ncbi:MAG: hypothetical protein ABF445_09955 [Leuconostoc mesenteroides]
MKNATASPAMKNNEIPMIQIAKGLLPKYSVKKLIMVSHVLSRNVLRNMQERLWLASLQVTSLHLLLFAAKSVIIMIPVNSPITKPTNMPNQNRLII